MFTGAPREPSDANAGLLASHWNHEFSHEGYGRRSDRGFIARPRHGPRPSSVALECRRRTPRRRTADLLRRSARPIGLASRCASPAPARERLVLGTRVPRVEVLLAKGECHAAQCLKEQAVTPLGADTQASRVRQPAERNNYLSLAFKSSLIFGEPREGVTESATASGSQ
jgi:hypothetical protein